MGYNQENINYFTPVLKQLLKRFDKGKHYAKALDVGSGEGDMAIVPSPMAKHVFGVDVFPELIATAKVETKKAGVTNTHFEVAPGEKLPFPNETFDLVVTTSTLEHVDNVDDCVDEMARVVKPDGLIVINVPNYFWIQEPHYKVYMLPLMPKPIMYAWLKLLRDPKPEYIYTVNYTTVPWLQKRLEKHGFTVYNHSLEILKEFLSHPNKIPDHWKIIRGIMKAMQVVGLNVVAYWIASKTHFYPSITLVARRGEL